MLLGSLFLVSSTVSLEVQVSVIDTVSFVASLLTERSVSGELRVSGKVPVMLFGIVELPAYIPVNYVKIFNVAGKQPLQLSAGWLGTEISPGQCVQFYITLHEQVHYVVEVREDRAFESDRVVAQYNGFGNLRKTFCLNYNPTPSVRGSS